MDIMDTLYLRYLLIRAKQMKGSLSLWEPHTLEEETGRKALEEKIRGLQYKLELTLEYDQALQIMFPLLPMMEKTDRLSRKEYTV
jgi:hypothetical protein